MPIKIELPEFFRKYAKFKWELLRRNAKYIEEWEQLQKIVKGKYGESVTRGIVSTEKIIGILPNELGISAVDLIPDALPEDRAFCTKWKIGFPIPPNMSWDEINSPITKYIINNEGHHEDTTPEQIFSDMGINTQDMLERMNFDVLNPWFLQDRPIIAKGALESKISGIVMGQRFSKEFAKHGKLNFVINLNYSNRRLLEEFKFAIAEWKELYDKAYKLMLLEKSGEEKTNIYKNTINEELEKKFDYKYKQELKKRNKKYEQKYHFDNFDDYLKVYDLRKQGVSWSKIKLKLGLNSVQTARNHFKSACDLIAKVLELYG